MWDTLGFTRYLGLQILEQNQQWWKEYLGHGQPLLRKALYTTIVFFSFLVFLFLLRCIFAMNLCCSGLLYLHFVEVYEETSLFSVCFVGILLVIVCCNFVNACLIFGLLY